MLVWQNVGYEFTNEAIIQVIEFVSQNQAQVYNDEVLLIKWQQTNQTVMKA